MKRMFKTLSASILSLCFLAAFSQNNSSKEKENLKYPSLLWEISGNGLEAPSYLYGTMHVSNRVAFHLTDTFFSALKSVDMVALETDPSQWMQNIYTSDFMLQTMQMMNSYGYGGSGFYSNAFPLTLPEDRIYAAALARENPLTNGMLYRMSNFGNQYEFEEDTYLDLFIFQAGKKLNKKVTHLEDFDESFKLMTKASLPDEEDNKSERPYNPKLFEEGKNIYELLEDSYRKGNLDMLDSLQKMMNPSKNYRKYALDVRNKIMADNMDSLMHHHRLFTGIGAAHLPGDTGVISILRRKGYTVRPIIDKTSPRSISEKDRLQELQHPVENRLWHSPDSAFTAALPGVLYETESTTNFKDYFFPEMINGAYYSVVRIKTYAPLTGSTPEETMEQVEKLFFENIPGKIIEKKEINVSGYPAWDLINKTKKNDIQRYHIVITPLEAYVFKMAATGDFVSTPYADEFFGSITLASPENTGWKRVEPAQRGFSVDMPGHVIQDKSPAHLKALELSSQQIQSIDPETGDYFLIMSANLHDHYYIEEDTFELNYITEKFAEQLKDYKFESRILTEMNGYPALDAKFSKAGEEGCIFTKTVIKGPHYYLLLSKTKEGQRPEQFFNSFTFTENKYDEGFQTYTDTSLYFTVKAPVTPPDDVFLREMMQRYNYGYNKKEDNSYKSVVHRKNFNYAPTAEQINVEYRQLHKYFGKKTAEKLWEEALEMLLQNKNLAVKDKKIIEDGDYHEMQVTLVDTNSTRAIKKRLILNHGVLYTLQATIDTVGEESPFIRTFFETFEPVDTAIGWAVLEDKEDTFFRHIVAGDSLTVEQAFSSVNELTFGNEHAPRLMNLISAYNFSKNEKLEKKTHLIDLLGNLKHPDITPFLIEQYRAAEDTVSLQLYLLEALAEQQTPKAVRSITELLISNTPLTDDDDQIGWVFTDLQDSLELAENLFPDILLLTRYPEYKDEIYELLALLVDSNFVRPKAYKKHLKAINIDANEKLKRQLASEESSSGSDYYYSSYYNDREYEVNRGSDVNYLVESYATILAPFYEKDENVKRFFNKLNRVQNEHIKLDVAVIKLKNDIPVEDSLWRHWASKKEYRVPLYEELQAINRLDKFPKEYATQAAIVEGLLYATSFDEEKDTFAFVDTVEYTVDGEKGYVYFFKSRKEDQEDWRLDFSAVQPPDAGKVELHPVLTKRGRRIAAEEDIQEVIEEKLKELRILNRERASAEDYSYRNNFGF